MVTDDSLSHEVECLTGSEQGRPTNKAQATSLARWIRREVGSGLVGGGEVLKAVIGTATRHALPAAVTALALLLEEYVRRHRADVDEPAAHSLARMNASEMIGAIAFMVASGAGGAIEEAMRGQLRRRYRKVLGVEDEPNATS